MVPCVAIVCEFKTQFGTYPDFVLSGHWQYLYLGSLGRKCRYPPGNWHIPPWKIIFKSALAWDMLAPGRVNTPYIVSGKKKLYHRPLFLLCYSLLVDPNVSHWTIPFFSPSLPIHAPLTKWAPDPVRTEVKELLYPKDPDPSRIESSEKNRNVGVIPFLGHTWILRDR